MDTIENAIADKIDNSIESTDDTLYRMNDELVKFVNEKYGDVAPRIFNIYQHLYQLNQNYHNDRKFFIEKLEQRVLDLIATSEDDDLAKERLEIYTKRALYNYFLRYGIELNIEEMTIYELDDLLEGYTALYNLDIPSCEDLLIDLGNDTVDGVERLTRVLANYSPLSESIIYDRLAQVGDHFFQHIVSYLQAKIYRGVEEYNQQDINLVLPLIRAEHGMISTRIVSDTLYYGKKDFTLDDYLDTLYVTLDSYNQDTLAIALEIVAANYLSSDRPIRSQTDLSNIINFRGLKNLEYPRSEDEIVPLVMTIMGKIKG